MGDEVRPKPDSKARVHYLYSKDLDRELWVRIFPDTTKKEYLNLWTEISRKQKGLSGAILTKREMYERLYDAHYQQGWSYKKCRDFAEKEWGLKFKSLEDLGQNIYRAAKRINPERYPQRNKKRIDKKAK